MSDREKTIAFDRQYCQHYEPGGITMIGGKEPNGLCKAGVVYLAQFPPPPDQTDPPRFGIFTRICCTSGNERSEEEQLASCPKWERRTLEQATKRADDIDKAMNDMRLVMPEVAKWKTWTKKNRVAKQGVIECPACKGKLHLSQAAYNGHVWGKCETEGCVSWMQ
jgi:hypothetical protein